MKATKPDLANFCKQAGRPVVRLAYYRTPTQPHNLWPTTFPVCKMYWYNSGSELMGVAKQ